VALDDLPASVAGPAVISFECLAADPVEQAKEQLTVGLAYVGISGMVLHSQYTFECAGLGRRCQRPAQPFFGYRWFLHSCLDAGSVVMVRPGSGWPRAPVLAGA
jgi:hypothetical protein